MFAPPQGTWGQPYYRMGPQGAVRHIWGPQGDPSGAVDPTLASIRAKVEALGGYWKLGETGAAARVDSSGNGQDLTANNAPASATGKIGSGCEFVAASSQDLVRAVEANIQPTTDFHIAFWFKPTTLPSSQVPIGMDDGADRCILHRIMADGSIEWYVFDVTGAFSRTILAAGTYAVDTWTFIVLGYTASTQKSMASANAGAFSEGSALLNPFNSATSSSLIVGSADSLNQYCDGVMDELIFVNGQHLTQDEIDYLYNGGAGNAIY